MREGIPQKLADEAAERLAAFELGLIDWPAVVSWADAWILQLDQFPELLLDVSLNATRPQEGASALGRIADQSNNATTYSYLKALWREKFQSGGLDAIGVARAAWKARLYAGWESEEWVQISCLDHFYDDLTAGWHQDDASRQRAAQALQDEVEIFLNV